MTRALLILLAIISLVDCSRSSHPPIDGPKVSGQRKLKFYRNPMDPSIHANAPTKDNMGMDYIPVYEDEIAPDSGQTENQATGRAAVKLTPAQEVLTGAQPIRVGTRILQREIEAPGRLTSGSRVSFQIFEQDLALIRVGQTFIAQSPSLPGRSLNGRIVALASILDPMTRTARVEGNLSGSEAAGLRTESTVTGVIQVETAKVVAVPENAVMHTGNQDLVFVTDGKGAYQPRSVALGIKAQGYYEVRKGVEAGSLISSGPNFLLDSESRIRAATYDQ